MLIDGTQLERPAPPLDELLRVGLESGPDEAAEATAEWCARSGSTPATSPTPTAISGSSAAGSHDTVHGENVRAYVTLREGAERPSSADLIVFARERVGYKAPEEIVFLEEMPLNPTGKIDRVGLKRMAEDHLHPHGLE